MRNAIVLLYNMADERAKQIEALAERHVITARVVDPAELNQTLGALSGLEEMTDKRYEGSHFTDEMLVMANFNKGMLNRFLDSFRDAGIPSVPLKAMLTETNSKWDSLTLHEELKCEYEYFKQMQAGRRDG